MTDRIPLPPNHCPTGTHVVTGDNRRGVVIGEYEDQRYVDEGTRRRWLPASDLTATWKPVR